MTRPAPRSAIRSSQCPASEWQATGGDKNRVTLSLTKWLFPDEDHEQGCNLIDKIAALARSSTELNSALRSAADEIGRTLGLERSAILLRHENNLRLVGDFCASGIGPVQREKLRQLDTDLTRELETQRSAIELADARSDPRVSRRLSPASNNSEEPAIRSILILPLVIDSENADRDPVQRRQAPV